MKPEALKYIDRLVGGFLVSLWPPLPPYSGGVPTVKSILFIRPGGIGDSVLLVPAIHAVRQQFPDAAIDILAEGRNAGVFPLCPGIRSVYRYDVPAELLATLRTPYDVVIDTEQWHRLSAVVARLTRSLMKIGFATNVRRRLFTHAVGYSHERYEADSFYNLLEPLGISSTQRDDKPFLQVPAAAVACAQNLLHGLNGRPYVVIFPGASIPERRWGAERFREVAAGVAAAGLGVVVVGAAVDKVEATAIASTTSGTLNLAGQTSLVETAALLQGAEALISGDSGVLHLAVGVGTPAVSLFGPGIARKWAPRGGNHRVVTREKTCSPCTRFGTTPPCPHGVRCLTEITPAEVLSTALELVRGG